jgi:hypothetical protein
MRSSTAAAGSAAVLVALLVSGCDGGTTGSATPQTTTQAATTTASSAPGVPGAGETSLPAIDTKQLDQPDPLASLAGDWRQDTTSKPIMAHVAKDGAMTVTQGGRTVKGQVIWMGDKHYRIVLEGSLDTPNAAEITADLSTDATTLTVHSSKEPGPIVYKRVS